MIMISTFFCYYVIWFPSMNNQTIVILRNFSLNVNFAGWDWYFWNFDLIKWFDGKWISIRNLKFRRKRCEKILYWNSWLWKKNFQNKFPKKSSKFTQNFLLQPHFLIPSRNFYETKIKQTKTLNLFTQFIYFFSKNRYWTRCQFLYF